MNKKVRILLFPLLFIGIVLFLPIPQKRPVYCIQVVGAECKGYEWVLTPSIFMRGLSFLVDGNRELNRQNIDTTNSDGNDFREGIDKNGSGTLIYPEFNSSYIPTYIKNQDGTMTVKSAYGYIVTLPAKSQLDTTVFGWSLENDYTNSDEFDYKTCSAKEKEFLAAGVASYCEDVLSYNFSFAKNRGGLDIMEWVEANPLIHDYSDEKIIVDKSYIDIDGEKGVLVIPRENSSYIAVAYLPYENHVIPIYYRVVGKESFLNQHRKDLASFKEVLSTIKFVSR